MNLCRGFAEHESLQIVDDRLGQNLGGSSSQFKQVTLVDVCRVAILESLHQRWVYPCARREFDFIIFTTSGQTNWPDQNRQLEIETVSLQVGDSRYQTEGFDSKLLRDFLGLILDSASGTKRRRERLRVSHQTRKGGCAPGNKLREAARMRLGQVDLAIGAAFKVQQRIGDTD